MPAFHCPYCGMQSPDAPTGGGSSFVCPNCGKAVEPPLTENGVPPPPLQNANGNDRWSAGPPEDSANRWSAQPPLGDDSSSSESVSQSSILPGSELGEAALVRPARSPLLWALIVLAIFLAALIGVVVLARWIRPWLTARRAAAQKATVEYWLPRLDNGGDESRREAAQAIVVLGPDAVCRTLDHISKDPGDEREPFPRNPGAVRALAGVGEEAVPGLCEGLRSPEPKIRAVAVEILLQMGAAGRASRDTLLTTLDDSNRWVRYYTIDTLGYLGADGGPAAKRLAEVVSSPDRSPAAAFARRHAVKALGRIGPEARDAMGALEKAAADDPDPEVCSSAKLAMKQIDVARLARQARREATHEMRQWLKDLDGDDTPAAIAAAEALGKLEFEGRPAAPALALMLRHPDRQRRRAAAIALGRLGLANADFIPTLEGAAREEDAEVRAAAVKALESPNNKP